MEGSLHARLNGINPDFSTHFRVMSRKLLYIVIQFVYMCFTLIFNIYLGIVVLNLLNTYRRR